MEVEAGGGEGAVVGVAVGGLEVAGGVEGGGAMMVVVVVVAPLDCGVWWFVVGSG